MAHNLSETAMPELPSTFQSIAKPTPELPLAGQTMLLVEDSRFASEAIRLLCLRSGARVRRADSLRSANRHMRSYSPSVVIVDIGLPDGSGLELISELAGAATRIPVILATSGDADAEETAVEAGADGFLLKPVQSIGAFVERVLSLLPESEAPAGLRPVAQGRVDPDRKALRDDLEHVARLLSEGGAPAEMSYATQFLSSVAHLAGDDALEIAASDLARHLKAGGRLTKPLERAMGLLNARLDGLAAV